MNKYTMPLRGPLNCHLLVEIIKDIKQTVKCKNP